MLRGWVGFVVRTRCDSYLSGHCSAAFTVGVSAWYRASIKVRGDFDIYWLGGLWGVSCTFQFGSDQGSAQVFCFSETEARSRDPLLFFSGGFDYFVQFSYVQVWGVIYHEECFKRAGCVSLVCQDLLSIRVGDRVLYTLY